MMLLLLTCLACTPQKRVEPPDGETDDTGPTGRTTDTRTTDTRTTDTGTTAGATDADGDGVSADNGDCDDADPSISPQAAERCDDRGRDEDCDGLVNDADPDVSGTSSFYVDADADGHGGDEVVAACEAPAGTTHVGADCDDTDSAVHPDALERCNTVDDDCDGATDEAGAAGELIWFAERDGDGYGDATESRAGCTAPTGYVADGSDCDDTDPDVNPGATEVCDGSRDEDCDGLLDDDDPTTSPASHSTWYQDDDGDRYGGATLVESCAPPTAAYVALTGDCDDTDAAVSPSGVEVCDPADADEDCDGAADDPSAAGQSAWYLDADADGYGGSSRTDACDAPVGHVEDPNDCDDTTSTVSPGANEVCDPADTDEDCDGDADNNDPTVLASTQTTFYADADGDGFGTTTTAAWCDLPSGFTTDNTDCDDAAAAIHPSAIEICDPTTTDEDCDGLADDADPDVTGTSTFYADADADGHGDPYDTSSACRAPAGAVTDADDCDDSNSDISPTAAEVCDTGSTDEDCDGLADDADPGVAGRLSFYADADGDTYGDPDVVTVACVAPGGTLLAAGDCDDTDAAVSPDGPETCGDGLDQDCTGADLVCPEPRYDTAYDADDAPFARVYGAETGDLLGSGLAVGDFDGDGVGDLVAVASMGDYTSYSDIGIVYGWYGGPPSGDSAADLSADLLYYKRPGASDRNLAAFIGNVGDIDNDGDDDLFMTVSSSQGHLYSGGQMGTWGYTSDAYTAVTCAHAAAAGDFETGSTAVEWVCANPSLTRVTVFSGTAATVVELAAESASDRAGYSVAGGADVDGDGADDVWIGAYDNSNGGYQAGAAYLVLGGLSGSVSLADADAMVTGSAGDALGYTVALGADLDGDGDADPVVSAIDAGGSYHGESYVFAGLASGTSTSADATATFTGHRASDAAGRALAVGDVDADGTGDLLIGTAYADDGGTSAGAAWLAYGPLSGTYTLSVDVPTEWTGPTAGDQLGDTLAILPDTDGDGDDELVFAGTTADLDTSTNLGVIWVWSGR